MVIQSSFGAPGGLCNFFIGQPSQAFRLKHLFCCLQNVPTCSHQKNVPPSNVLRIRVIGHSKNIALNHLFDTGQENRILKREPASALVAPLIVLVILVSVLVPLLSTCQVHEGFPTMSSA